MRGFLSSCSNCANQKRSADLEDPKATYNSLSSTELNALFPLISFPNYFAAFTPRPSYPDPVIVTSPPYLANVTKIIEGTEADVLEAYFVFRTASHASPSPSRSAEPKDAY